MSSSVFFKFKSQKEPTRVEFDGTTISVFELKRDIIIKSGLGDGTDFDLAIYTEDGAEEYDDDTTIIPRSTTVIARRLPPQKPGAGRAARYVSGKMPVSAKNSARKEQTAKAAPKPVAPAPVQLNPAMTEEEKMMAMFQAQSEQWNAQQEEMSHQSAVYKPGSKKPANVPDHEPPNGYICYRCGQKGHWIQVCPTNDNPEFDNRPRVKRTTGIPRSFLQTVDKSTLQQSGADGEEVKPPSGVMVNSDGEFVIARPDQASWEQFQAKTKSSAAAQKAASDEDKELDEKGLLCSIDKRIFIDPMKTPCCEKTYCNDCITNALIESDFVCPNCHTDGVLIDDLKADDDASANIQTHRKEKEAAKTKERSQSPPAAKSPAQAPSDDIKETPGAEIEAAKAEPVPVKSKSPTPPPVNAKTPPEEAPKSSVTPSSATGPSEPPKSKESNATNSKKRPAEDLLDNPKVPKGPKAMRQQQESKDMQNMIAGMNGMPGNMMPSMMNFPMGNMNGFNPTNMNPMMMMGMNPMMNPMMGMNGFNPMAMNNMFPGGNFGMSGNNGMPNMNGMSGMNGMNGMNMNGSGGGGMNGSFNNNNNPQARKFNSSNPGDEDAYFRKPVNPNRHQNRQRRVRPSDYREL
ncbi:DWNN domain-containing protein [Xylariaceae sp. FL0016]|nr:DWNN domain-containing protein [Xylariaceae sp. FL0016]